MQLTLDVLDGSSVEIGATQSQITVGGYAEGIPAQARSDPYVLCRSVFEAGGPQLFSPHPYVPKLRLMKILSRPAGNTNDAALSFVYEGPGAAEGSSGSAVLIVEDSTALQTEIETVDLNGRVIQAIYVPGRSSDDGEVSANSSERPVPKGVDMTVLRPRRTLSVSGLVFGRTAPASWTRKSIGMVNVNPWPTGSLWTNDEPLKPGFWLCTQVSASVERYSRFSEVFEEKLLPYRVRASFWSQVIRDWSHFGVYKNPWGNVPADLANEAANVKALRESPYSTQQQTVDTGGVNGFVRVGLYEPVDFAMAFGF